MTEKLKDLLHDRADAVDFAVPDVDALARAGERRRRRRSAAVVAGSALAVVAVGAAVALPSVLGGSSPDAADAPAPPPALSWVEGSTLHSPDLSGGEVALDHEVRAYVRTSAGFVLAAPDGTVWSMVDGKETRVGTTDAKDPHLVADDEGTLAGWMGDGGGHPAYVVLDQATGDTKTFDDVPAGATDPAGPGSSPYFYAIDGRTAYWRDARGVVATDVDSGEADVVAPHTGKQVDVVAVEDGLIAFAGGQGTSLGTSLADATPLPWSYEGPGAFSPDGHWYTEDADEPKVYDTTTGKKVDLDLQYNFAAGYGWLDSGTLLLIGQDGWRDKVELVRCTVPAGDCRTAVPDLGTFDQLHREGFALPAGSRIGE